MGHPPARLISDDEQLRKIQCLNRIDWHCLTLTPISLSVDVERSARKHDYRLEDTTYRTHPPLK